MTLRKFAVQMPLLVAILLLFTFSGNTQPVFSQSQQAYRYLNDFSYLTKDRRNSSEKAEDFIRALKRGDRRAFQEVTYNVLLRVIVRLKENADLTQTVSGKKPYQVGFLRGFMLQMDGDEARNRATLVKAALPGIFNLDPRVRLVAASWLRVLRPDASMMRAVKMAVGVDIRVIRYDHAKKDFVFTHPKILETVASWQEYYREKDLDWPGVFAPGAIDTLLVDGRGETPTRIGGQGVNNNLPKMVDRDANTNAVDAATGGNDFIVSGLDARRWGAPNMWDKDRNWEKALPLGVGSEASNKVAPQNLSDYYRRLNASIKLAYYGVKDGQLLPDGNVFGDKQYEGKCKPGNFVTHSGEVRAVTCMQRAEDEEALNDASLLGMIPGAGNIISPRPIIFDTVDDAMVTAEFDLQTKPNHKDAYHYYPDVVKDASLSKLPEDMREKMRLLLGQRWQEGTRVPIGSGRMYVYVNAYGDMVVGNPWVELTKLDMFVTRYVWFNKIKAGYKKAMALISKDTFYTLWASIDGESPEVIPFLSTMGTEPKLVCSDVPVLIEGLLKNPVISNKYVILRALKGVYEQKPPYVKEACTPQVKNDINIAIWEARRDINRIDVEVGKVLYNEFLTVGYAPSLPMNFSVMGESKGGAISGSATLIDPYGPIGKGAAVSTVTDKRIGFANANQEILSNSHRAIVSSCHFDTVNNCGGLDSKTVNNLDRLFKQRFYNLTGPDGKSRDYYKHRNEYNMLWRGTTMKLMMSDAERNNADPNSVEWGGKDDVNLGANLDARMIEPVPTASRSRETRTDSLVALGFSSLPPSKKTTANKVTKDVSLWEAARYVDSLVSFNIDRMKQAQEFIEAVRNGNSTAFREAKWDVVESAVLLVLKRLETIHRYPTSGQSSVVTNEDPTKVTTKGAGSPIEYKKVPEIDFFDLWDRFKVIDEYEDREAGIRTAKRYKEDAALGFVEVVDANEYGQNILVRKQKEFIPVAEQVKNVSKSTFGEEKRQNIVKSALGGIFNKDPRIRLTAVHFLRRMGPDETMLEAVEKARNITATSSAVNESPESDDYRSAFIDTHTYHRYRLESSDLKDTVDYYVIDQHKYEGAIDRDVEARYKGLDEYRLYVQNKLSETAKYKQRIPHPAFDPTVNEYNRIAMLPSNGTGNPQQPARFYGYYQLKAPSEELEKLYKMIRRVQLVKQIRGGDVNVMKNINRSEFEILSEPVDDEWVGYVPFLSFHSVDVMPGARIPSKYATFNGNDIRVIKRGIDNPNFLVQKGTAMFLIQFYNFYDKCTDFAKRTSVSGCQDGKGYQPDGSYKREIREAMDTYIRNDIVVQEFELAFNGENPDGRAVIKAGSDLSMHINRGGERVYLSLPERIRKDIRDAVWGENERLPDELKNILGIISTRAPQDNVLNYFNVMLGIEPPVPQGDAGDQLQ